VCRLDFVVAAICTRDPVVAKASDKRDHAEIEEWSLRLVLWDRAWLSRCVHAVGIEDERSYFGLRTLRRNLLPLPQEGDSRSIADSDYDFMIGVDGRMGWRNQRFLTSWMAIGGHRNP